jgi:hypothetical protein
LKDLLNSVILQHVTILPPFLVFAEILQSKHLNLANTYVFVNLNALIGGGLLEQKLKMGAKNVTCCTLLNKKL